jgi:D-ornithine 4,5-aminomutase subunit beta
MKLHPNEKLDIREVLTDLEHYHPKRKNWVWRKHVKDQPNWSIYLQGQQ